MLYTSLLFIESSNVWELVGGNEIIEDKLGKTHVIDTFSLFMYYS